MERIYFTDHKGARVLIEDFSGMRPGEEFWSGIEKARQMIHAEPQASVLALFDCTNTHFDQEIVGRMKEFTKSNTPYVKAVSVVGVKGLQEIALNAITTFTGRKFKTFSTREDALNWLIAQK